MNNMKRLFWIFLFTLNFTDITAQSFYDMLRETMDSTYVDIINRSSKYNDKERFKYNNIYQPWGYNPSDKLKAIKSKNKKYNYKYGLIGDYDARLLKDTICIFSFNTTFTRFRWTKKSKRTLNYEYWNINNRNRLHYKSRPIKGGFYMYNLIYVYDRNVNKWVRINNIKKMHVLGWYYNLSSGTTLIGECINYTCSILINKIRSKDNENEKILYIDNTFGLLKRKDIYLASEQDMKKSDYKKFKNILGWVHIDLKDDTLMISMKNVDGKKYLKHGLKYSIKDQCTAYFKYNDSTKKWSYLFHSYQQENH